MNSKVAQKLIAIGLAVLLCFIVACGKSTSSSANSENPSQPQPEENLSGPAACYMGINRDAKACAQLKTINAASEGYKNPYTDSSFMATANKDQYRRPVQAVDLKRTSQNLKIAPSFVLSEFMSIEKGNIGIFSTAVVKIIQKLRDKTGAALKINSAFRSPKWNEGIDGSATWSRHQYGDGVDIASSKVGLDTLISYCKQLGATFTLKYTSHVHCDWRNMALEPQFFGALDIQQLKQTSVEEDQMNILTDYVDSSQILISGELKAGNVVRLSSFVKFHEDPSELHKQWVIFAPNGDQINLEQSEVSLPLQKGTYQVINYIGASIQLNKSFFVN
ncbi:MAG: D-Ala-D-Ala carboxypeptidase family metallohydrolase [Bdellovibrionota bacterium]